MPVESTSIVTGAHAAQSRFSLIDAKYGNAELGRVEQLRFEYPLIATISTCCSKVFAQLDRDDHVQRRVARAVWLLRSTISQTLLNFNDPRLGLHSLIERLEMDAANLPSIRAEVRGLADLVISVVVSSKNLKREAFLQQLTQSSGDHRGVTGVFAGLQGSNTPGWPASLSPSEDFPGGDCIIFRTRKEMARAVFERVIIPGTLQFAARPLVMDLLYGGQAANVTIFGYGRERIQVPDPIALPQDCAFKVHQRNARKIGVSVRQEDSDAASLDEWANDSFWAEMRARHSSGDLLSERDVMVPARFVLFADGSGAFLPSDKSVVEISDLFDQPVSVSHDLERLPRKAVRDLEERDLVMLRLAGGGDYVDEVADGLMEAEGLARLRSDAVAWKSALFEALKRYGEGAVAKALRETGVKLRSATYLWTWASNEVIAPQDFDTFKALMGTLEKLGESLEGYSAAEYADTKWKEMDHLKTFQHRAGLEIRRALLDRVRALVKQGHQIDTAESIQLPGLAAGRMGLLRVAAADAVSVQIPLSRAFQLFPVQVA